jgi:cytochrome c oxidase subunit 2
VHAPDLHGVYGRQVHLSDGRTVQADDAYLRDSILLPNKDVVAGFTPIMPSFQGVASESDLLKLIAYLKSLATTTGEQGAQP